MELTVNGKKVELQVSKIQAVIEHYELAGRPIVVEVDGVIVAAQDWPLVEVRSGMVIELVHFVGGG